MARLPYVDPATAPPSVRDTMDKLPVQLNVFKMMAHAETNFRPLILLGSSILSQQQLSPKLRELTILLVGKRSPAEYEWVQHVPIAKATGATDAQIAALDRGALDDPAFDPVERDVLALAAELLRQPKASDAALAAVRRHLSDREVVELVVTVGYYMLVARILETGGVDLDPPMGTKITDSLRG